MESRLLLVGKNTLLQDALRFSLTKSGYSVLTADPGLAKLQEEIDMLKPDVVVWDDKIIKVCFKQIVEISKSLQKSCYSILVLDSKMIHYFAEGLLNGVEGFIHKQNGLQELKKCLSIVCEGSVFISPVFSGKTLPKKNFRRSKYNMSIFTPRERTILQWIKEGDTSKEIAAKLNISYRTVQNHRQNICNKLGLTGRNSLRRYAKIHFESLK